MQITIDCGASSNLASSSYDDDRCVLTVTFRNGAVWEYGSDDAPVPEWLVMNMMDAPSKGKFFISNIKGHYPERKVAG